MVLFVTSAICVCSSAFVLYMSPQSLVSVFVNPHHCCQFLTSLILVYNHVITAASEKCNPLELLHELPTLAATTGALGEDHPPVYLQHRAAVFRNAGSHGGHCPLRIPDGETAVCAAFCTLHWRHRRGKGEC